MKKLIGFMLLISATFAHATTFDVDSCEVRFSPRGGASERIVELIESAHKSVRVLAYSFTSADIAGQLMLAKHRGVSVEVIMDRSASKGRSSVLPTLIGAGVPVYVDGKHAIAHNKTIIVDGRWVATGSYNFTGAAEKSNGENSLICDTQAGATAYLADWQRHRDHSERAR